ncbi:hypothetical protein [Pseudoxanthomonas indica]|uniref:Uncharacterized protein n=1 Tax=Pseudoxanthomonas indica TaxID=428993 RepID=A0A1T5KVJ1_9GAMM|nr:hypothetical protein [Pseudoxanthomonas indica]GGD52220.1 hypothetical protein GCM10007235_25580 [Pseudoxanthomonas indica]SKC67804.1 hypothetical protein SAMN06296058_2103 [Pseudoxanthomonas indica]
MLWHLTQLAIWALLLVPTFFATRWCLGKLKRMPCDVPLMVLVLALAAMLAILVTPVALPLGAVVLPYSVLAAVMVVTNFRLGDPYFGVGWSELVPPGASLAATFLMACALIWLILQRKTR